ncbi:MAG: alpha-galactosidase [Alphaproteobacteria bacterium]|nr:alpha-galactosidase [Alphaproteobacteria bacterium]MBV9371330.1 alpha-galactosidase [Alphaproteobacteria bacterium]MBV9901794.1 alpha-galactosidase [Alphaproteobacteria bacterium]
MAIEFEPDGAFVWRGIRLSEIAVLVDGQPSPAANVAGSLAIREEGDSLRLILQLPDEGPRQSLGLRFGRVEGVRAYLRNGYQSWDGSYFVPAGTQAAGDEPRGKSPTVGHAMTALLPAEGQGALLLGFARHDRFQSRFRFGGDAAAMSVDVETLLDGADRGIAMEPLLLIAGDEVEEVLRAWSRHVAAQSPLPPRTPPRRITGWCSWYSLYAAIDEPVILEHLAAAADFRDRRQVPLDVFQIDDGFTPEMGDWLEVKPQFPRGMKPLLDDVAAAGFTPGLWIAPFMVGNRSRLFAEHPDWVVRRRDNGEPLAHMTFYGEFRWHKRSEEYYILDVTNPWAETWLRHVFRTWRHDWGCRYFKTDFMLFGSEYGPDEAVWHRPGLSRIAIWTYMAALIREEIGEDALWLGCGCPLWASVGYVDAVRIGRDIGVSWEGDQSAESLLRDQLTRNHASGILWQADPDCVLLRERFHHLDDEQVRSLALFAGLAGGVLMTSDRLDALPPGREALFAALLREGRLSASFPELGRDTLPIVQRVRREDGTSLVNLFNPTAQPVEAGPGGALAPFASRLLVDDPADPLRPWASGTSRA